MLTCSIKTLVRRKTAAENSNLEDDPQKIYIAQVYSFCFVQDFIE